MVDLYGRPASHVHRSIASLQASLAGPFGQWEMPSSAEQVWASASARLGELASRVQRIWSSGCLWLARPLGASAAAAASSAPARDKRDAQELWPVVRGLWEEAAHLLLSLTDTLLPGQLAPTRQCSAIPKGKEAEATGAGSEGEQCRQRGGRDEGNSWGEHRISAWQVAVCGLCMGLAVGLYRRMYMHRAWGLLNLALLPLSMLAECISMIHASVGIVQESWVLFFQSLSTLLSLLSRLLGGGAVGAPREPVHEEQVAVLWARLWGILGRVLDLFRRLVGQVSLLLVITIAADAVLRLAEDGVAGGGT